MSPQPTPRKQVSLLILFSFVMLIVMLTFVSNMAPPAQSTTFPAAIVYGVGAVAILGAAFLSVFLLRPNQGLSAQRFQTQMLICLAASEFGTLFGFAMHQSSGSPMWPLSAASVVVDLLVILPRVLAYWRVNDSDGGTRTL